MKKLLFKIFVVVMAVTLTLNFVSCGKKESVANVRNKVITVGYTDYQPMNYKENNLLIGFDTELALMTLNALGYEVKFKLIKWDKKYIELNGGTIDCIWNGLTSNDEDKDEEGNVKSRSELLSLTFNYMNNTQCIVRNVEKQDLTDVEQMKGSKIVYEGGSAGETFVSDNIDNSNREYNLKPLTSQMEAIMQVKNGTADYAVVDILLANAIVGGESYKNLTVNNGIEIGEEYYAVGFRNNADGKELARKVNEMFKAFALTGQLEELAKKYKLENAVFDYNKFVSQETK